MAPVFVALVIGVIAAYIAYQQYRLAHAKLKFDLFQKRYDIFYQTWAYLSAPLTGALQSPFAEFDKLRPQALFLFGEEVDTYLDTAQKKMTELWTIQQVTRQNNNIIRPEHIDRHSQLERWFATEAITGAKQVFRKYLDVSQWR